LRGPEGPRVGPRPAGHLIIREGPSLPASRHIAVILASPAVPRRALQRIRTVTGGQLGLVEIGPGLAVPLRRGPVLPFGRAVQSLCPPTARPSPGRPRSTIDERRRQRLEGQSAGQRRFDGSWARSRSARITSTTFGAVTISPARTHLNRPPGPHWATCAVGRLLPRFSRPLVAAPARGCSERAGSRQGRGRHPRTPRTWAERHSKLRHDDASIAGYGFPGSRRHRLG
jgi:hypothetical protein